MDSQYMHFVKLAGYAGTHKATEKFSAALQAAMKTQPPTWPTVEELHRIAEEAMLEVIPSDDETFQAARFFAVGIIESFLAIWLQAISVQGELLRRAAEAAIRRDN